ncbi:hypothetical protein BKA58DRAFT_456560 [Alternaria rosae]|uniref:uncharacterized protein n=1 Tax=Alternaria rosae TaxID=1187941 RepID=UPI001E8EA26C|nr:uncharacterized protein BKA58DRAFT_456560 [Alternaria rosae]KAH6872874.1 hypothetical protein BKA58DRAFT_456560 [Alternaria rosae]
MRLNTSVIAGFIAFGAATPAGFAVKPTSTEDPVDAVPAQHTPVVDGNWHIGCDKNNYCSYYQGDDMAVRNINSVSPRTIALSEATCKQCSSQDTCRYCENALGFRCRDCDHYQCEDVYLKGSTTCFDIQPELADAIRNHTVTATILETTISTSVVTVTAMPTSEASISDIITTITLARTALPPRHTGPPPRDEVASNDRDNQSPTRRTAFKQSECFPCNDQTCPECHADCAECDKYLCNNLATHTTVCMSVRSKWQPPGFNVSASGPSETTTTTQTVVISTIVPTSSPVVTVTVSAPITSTTTVVVAPQSSPCTTTTTSIPLVTTSTVTVVTQRPQTSTVTVVAQRPQTTTVTVVTQRPQTGVVTVVAQQPQTKTVTVQKPASTVIYQQPGTTSIVTVQNPASTVIYQQPGTTSIVTYHYQDPASTIVLQPPTVTASRSPHVLEIPVTVITTATHTVARSVRANQTPAPMSRHDSIIAKPICDACDDNPECDRCDFACDQGCERFLCKDPLSEAELCVAYLEDAEASKAYATSMASGDFLGSAAMLLVLAGDETPSSNTSTTHLQPAISNGTRPNFSFAEEDCYLCESGDESCDMCDWQFTCGIKKKCFHNGAREVVEMCFEKGEKCRP